MYMSCSGERIQGEERETVKLIAAVEGGEGYNDGTGGEERVVMQTPCRSSRLIVRERVWERRMGWSLGEA
jgi:hypothetical protein